MKSNTWSITGFTLRSAMNEFIAERKVKPVIDQVFDFKDAPAAYALMESGNFFGKIVIRM